jgi:hypothetical protein
MVTKVFCDNPDCPARGKTGEGNIKVHSHKEERFRCTTCKKTFAATKGTPFYRLHKDRYLFVIVIALLTRGCPLQAIVVAFGLDERTPAMAAGWTDHVWSVDEGVPLLGVVSLGGFLAYFWPGDLQPGCKHELAPAGHLAGREPLGLLHLNPRRDRVRDVAEDRVHGCFVAGQQVRGGDALIGKGSHHVSQQHDPRWHGQTVEHVNARGPAPCILAVEVEKVG